MKRYIAVLELDDDEEIVGDANISYTYRSNGTNYGTDESVELKAEDEGQRMNKRKLQILARHLIGKCLGLTVAAKNIDIVSYEDGGLFPSYLVFTILGKNNINYVLREQLCGIWKLYINNMAITELRLKDFEEGGKQ